MAQPAMTAETLALIAETEEKHEGELPPAFLPLTISRGRTPDGAIVPRCFIAQTTLMQRTLSGITGTRNSAYIDLQRQIRKLGFEPMWTSFTDETAVDDIPANESEEETIPAVETITPADEPEEEIEEPGEHEDPVYGLVSTPPVLDKGGWLTPVSDPLAYKLCYLAAWELVTGFSVYQFRDLSKDGANLRASVAAVMMSGDAGAKAGVIAKAVNPWALGTNGETEMPWVRVLKGTPDPTTRPFKAGMGEARETNYLNLSGNPVHPERYESAREWRQKRAARNFVGTKGTNNSVAARDSRNEKRAQAHAAGQAAKQNAINAGLDEETQDAHYKWAYAATFRFLGEIHTTFESQLAELGVTEADILETVEQMRNK